MRHIHIITIAFVFLFFTLSCEKEPFLVVSPDAHSYSFSEQGGSQQILFSCNNEWSVSVSESWIHVNPSSGSSSDGEIVLTIDCDPNSTYEDRMATILLSSKGFSEDICVTQDAKLGILVSSEKYYLTHEEQTVEIEVKSNVKYSVIIDDVCRDWISLGGTKSLATNTVFFNIAANSNFDDREGSIRFVQNDGTTTEVKITQKQWNALFLSTPRENILSFKQQLFEIKSLTNVELEVLIDSDWIAYEKTRGLNESIICLSVAENLSFEKRSCQVVLKSNSVEEIIHFTQYGQPIDLSAAGTANCYLVPLKDSYFSIDASVAGNDVAKEYYQINGGESAVIVWNSGNKYQYLIDDVQYDVATGRIFFRSNKLEGNALIALRDENETILWSWHLWLSAADPNDNIITFSNGTKLMDRYLGATSEDEIGLYYQWGRKDPFISARNGYIRPSGNPVTVEYCISHPYTFVGGGYESTNWDWNTEHTAIWSYEKSIYDPCPPGWKVMDGNCLSSLSEGCYVDENINCYIIGEPNCTPQTMFRSTGLLHSSGSVQGTSEHISIWTNSGTYHGFYTALEKSLSFDQHDKNFKDSYVGRAYGGCVRCQREE